MDKRKVKCLFTFSAVLIFLCGGSSIALANENSPNEAWVQGEGEEWADGWGDEDELQNDWSWRAYTELALGTFRGESPSVAGTSLAESRTQLTMSGYVGELYLNGQFELLLDDVDDNQVQLLTRELYLDADLNDSLSLRLGQQVLTWGTGDFIFLNDFFPKNWQSMLSGRDDDYLKSSSASVKLSYFAKSYSVDAVWTPTFTPDVYVSGERFAYYHPQLDKPVVAPRVIADKPSDSFANGQLALRWSATRDGVEYGLYGYRGFYTQPSSVGIGTGRNYFSRLDSVGASVRLPVGPGIANAEFSYWSSSDDRAGNDPNTPNSQAKYLLAYEQELFSNFTAGFQLYSEQTLDYAEAIAGHVDGLPLAKEWHHNITFRATYLAMEQKLTLSVFTFYSPDADDYYLKPKVTYRHDDHWSWVVGLNEFGGDLDRQWGQFKPSSNVYGRVRYRF